MPPRPLPTLDAVRPERSNALIGNGLSRGLDDRFAYDSLLAPAQNDFSNAATAAFDRVGRTDFEAVLRLLDDAAWVVGQYEAGPTVAASVAHDSATVRGGLVAALAKTHFRHTYEIDAVRLGRTGAWIRTFETVFTTNYDLLLYWANMAVPTGRFDDC